MYAGLGELDGAAQHLTGFPSHPIDERLIEWGAGEEISPHGRVRLTFKSVDSLGHCVATVDLSSSEISGAGPGQRVVLQLPFDPASMDRFVEELRQLDSAARAVATLAGAA